MPLDIDAGLVAVGQLRGYLLQAPASASLSHEIVERLSLFIEPFFASRNERDRGDTLGRDTGVIYLLTRRIAAKTTLNHPRLSYAVRAGLGLRFGR